MQFKSVKKLIRPLVTGGQHWQNVSLSGEVSKPRYFFSDIQWFIILLSIVVLLKLTNGISKDIVGYVISAFAISVSLFMSLLVSIFDKFENTEFGRVQKTEEEYVRLVQKKNFFKRFISITSYLVVLSIIIILLCSLTYLFNLADRNVSPSTFTISFKEINWFLTLKNSLLLLYRVCLNYLLLNYLLLTFFVAGSAYEYYISEIDRRKIAP